MVATFSSRIGVIHWLPHTLAQFLFLFSLLEGLDSLILPFLFEDTN